ncbi:MAG: hypothetical protein EAZ30_01320 [Betaproteobacteria bacterium]|nr:MAG: hypothetical protein EAZ30_01320 [Betaproteobacteria bacterium]
MKSIATLSILLTATLLSACGPSPEQLAREKALKDLEAAAKAMEVAGKKAESAAQKGGAELGAALGDVMKAMGGMAGAAGGAVGSGSFEPIDFRTLKEVLPQALAGFEKGESSGEKNNAFGIAISQAQQSFQSADGKQRIRFEVTDPGSLAGPFALANVWMNIDIDKETSSGYEKTSTVDGRKLHEKWDKGSKQGEATLVVGNRFLVEVDAQGVEMKEVKALLAKVDVAKLESMKGAGKKS